MNNYTKRIIIAIFAMLGEIFTFAILMTFLLSILFGWLMGCQDIFEFYNLIFKS